MRGPHTVSVALAAAGAAFLAFALLPLSGAPLFLPAIAACVPFGLAPSYRIDGAPTLPTQADAPSW